MNTIFSSVSTFVSGLFNKIILDSVLLYSKMVVSFEKKLQKYPLIQKTIQKCIETKNKIVAILEKRRHEPFYDNWVSVSKLIINENDNNIVYKYNLEETYEKTSSERLVFLDSNLLNMENIMNENENVKELLIISKFENTYNCFVVNNIFMNSRYYEINREPCQNPFLSIEYRHSMMKHPVPINIEKGFFIVGNHILSKSFVLRYLEYTVGSTFPDFNNEDFYYDLDYEIHIIDKNIDTIVLKSTECIVLEKKNYFVKQNYFIVKEMENKNE